MPSFTGKTFANFYKNLLGINQSSNTGVDATTREVQDGAGNNTAIQLSDDRLKVKPVNDNTLQTFVVNVQSGLPCFTVDTINKIVRAGETLSIVMTQYAYFGTTYIDATGASAFAADTHYAISFGGANAYGALAANIAMGSSTSSSFNDTNPATSLTISATAQDIVGSYWYVPTHITIDAVQWLHAADAATGDVTAAHVMAYDVDTDNGSTSGDLSNGVVVADGSNITNAGYEQIYYQSMTIQNADVDAGKVILFTFASDTVNSDFSINATVKYHIR